MTCTFLADRPSCLRLFLLLTLQLTDYGGKWWDVNLGQVFTGFHVTPAHKHHSPGSPVTEVGPPSPGAFKHTCELTGLTGAAHTGARMYVCMHTNMHTQWSTHTCAVHTDDTLHMYIRTGSQRCASPAGTSLHIMSI